MNTSTTVTTAAVQVMGRKFNISCPLNKVKDLEQSADYLEQKLHELMACNNTVNRENLLIIIALNITRELLEYKNLNDKTKDHLSLVSDNLRELKAKIEKELIV